jgi:hypothetical protein
VHYAAPPRTPSRRIAAERIPEKLRAGGVVYRLKIFPTAPHGIPIAEQWARSSRSSNNICAERQIWVEPGG